MQFKEQRAARRPVPRVHTNTRGIVRTVYGFLAPGECRTCDDFFPYGPKHDTGCKAHCSCGRCF